jgi:selenocysteine lyase/cysteine desulfurase
MAVSGLARMRGVPSTTLRAAFPVLADRAYLNAGTFGPLPSAAASAAAEVAARAAAEGRARPYFERLLELRERQRSAYAALLGADAADVALTTSTSDGLVRVLGGLDLGPEDEVLTAPDEHPGLLGPLITLRERRGLRVRTAPFAALADAVGPATRLVACSHVSWMTGALRPDGLAALPDEVPVVLDGAQGVGAVPTDVAALGCACYAGSGQKWLCGPMGTGMLWVAPAWRERVAPLGATYINLADAAAGLDGALHPDARRYDAPAVALESVAGAMAAHDVLAAEGWDAVFTRARDLAAELASALAERGREVAPRDATTLVSWEDDAAETTAQRLAEAGVIVRFLPGAGRVRASVGAWNDGSDLERLLAAL